MRDLTSTKREFTALARRIYRRAPLSVNVAFRGVIGRSFGIWIGEHWGLSNPSLFRPVEREFQTQKKPFALLNWPQQKEAGETNYNFLPTLHLTCFPQHTNNSLFELNTTGVFQTLTLKQPAGAREDLGRNVLVERALPESSLNWLSSLCNLRVLCASVVTFLRNSEAQRYREHRGFTEKAFYPALHTREYRFLQRILHTFNRESNTRRQSTELNEFLSAPARDIERSLRSEVRRFERATSFHRDFALVRSGSATKDVRNHFVVALPPSILPSNSTRETADGKTVSTSSFSNLSTSNHWQQTINLHPRLDRQFLITPALSAKNDPADRETHFGPNVFTTLALNFAAPKVSETELVAQRISQFVSSPELTHIKRQQAMSDEVVNALRGLRTPYVESKPVPMPVMPSIQQLTNQVRDQLERELRIERERRGR